MAPEATPRSNDRTGTSYYKVKTQTTPGAGRSQAHTPTPHSSHSHSHNLSTSSHSHSRSSSLSQMHANSNSHTHNQSNSQTTSFFGTKSTTPMASPRPPHSVGQPYPPRISPGQGRMGASDARTPSPNYFGLSIEPMGDLRDSAAVPRENWSPATSSVKSFGAAIPKQLPLDANPEFEAFRRQADANRGRSGFSLSTSQFGIGGGPGSNNSSGNGNAPSPVTSTPSAAQRPRPPRWHTHASDSSEASSRFGGAAVMANPRIRDLGADKMDTDADSLRDSAYVSADSKRNSEASLNPPSVFNMGRHESPAQMETPFEAPTLEQAPGRRSGLSKVDDRHPRLSMMQGKADLPTPDPTRQQHRAETLPPKLETGGPTMMSPAQLKDLLETVPSDDVLLLDLRVSPLYAQSRIRDALNLCIPTTLLKRATFNLQKLQQTFQADADQDKFASWRSVGHLIVYEANSSEKRDAIPAVNMIKKFTNEGYSGVTAILRGGFNTFAGAHPHLIDSSATSGAGRGQPSLILPGRGGNGSNGNGSSVAPVIGGVMLPQSNNGANPFFGNIRQNQDLVDGVGQMDVGVPLGLDTQALPRWLKEAADKSNHGKKVSDKFLQIELTEQARMKAAYSVQNFDNAPGSEGRRLAQVDKVQLSGIEKGGKNRYKNILPFEHARVKLQGRPEGACDYVNASHVRATRSHKRYIASQGPLPETFEDFWSVIWDQDVRVIVMLTAESEGGQLKCHPYWQGKEFGPIKLRALSENKVSLDIDRYRSVPSSQNQSPDSAPSAPPGHNNNAFSWSASSIARSRQRANTTTFNSNSAAPTPSSGQSQGSGETSFVIIRKFALSHNAHPRSPIREITHLHYPSWPDFGAPAQPSHLLALVELANVMQRASMPVDVPGALASASGSTDSPSGSRRGTPPRGAIKTVPLGNDAPESDPHARPMLVHCSAGCGRTGTFCTVDTVIDMLKRQRLRAVRKAEQIIARREEEVARQMASRDADGDVSMDADNFSPGTAPPPEQQQQQSSFFSPQDQQQLFFSPLTPNHPHLSQSPAASPFPDLADANDEYEDKEEGIDTSWLDDDTIDLIANTVEDFREQRLSMVQSLRQFVLCYETITEWIWRLQERGGGGGLGNTIEGRLRAHARTGSLAFF